MIIQINNNDGLDEILVYLKKNISKCLYLYIDIRKYGISDNLKVWKVVDNNKSIQMVIMKYYRGVQLFSECNCFSAKEVAEFIKTIDHKMITGDRITMDILKQELYYGYISECGYIHRLEKIIDDNNNLLFKIEKPDDSDFWDIAELICSDNNIGSSYEVDEIREQLLDRRKTDFGRNLVVKLGDGRIIGHIATYAELESIAIIGGVIVATGYRNLGIAKFMVGFLCQELQKENKDIYLFVYKDYVRNMYNKLGFIEICECEKLLKE